MAIEIKEYVGHKPRRGDETEMACKGKKKKVGKKK